jgi:hypothetical protein
MLQIKMLQFLGTTGTAISQLLLLIAPRLKVLLILLDSTKITSYAFLTYSIIKKSFGFLKWLRKEDENGENEEEK